MKKNMPDDAIVRLIDLPHGIGGAIMEDEDGFVSIYVNARHGHYAQLDDLDHEITHVENNDLHNDDPIEVIEARADGLPSPLKSIPHLMRASDLLPPSQSLPQAATPPVQGKVAERSEVGRGRSPISPHQAAVLLRAITDLDAWLFKEQYDF